MTSNLSYCGYPASVFAMRKYGEGFLADRISQVQYCEHGDLCEECCFLYTGRMHTNRKPHMQAKAGHRAWLPVYQPGRPNVPLRPFFYWAVFGRKPTILIHPTCKSRLCVNISHMEARYSSRTDDGVATRMRICQHGSLCQQCCWPWLGHKTINDQAKYVVLKLNVRFFDRRESALRHIVWNKTGRMVLEHERVGRTCKNRRCVNIWHLHVISSRTSILNASAYSLNHRKHMYALSQRQDSCNTNTESRLAAPAY